MSFTANLSLGLLSAVVTLVVCVYSHPLCTRLRLLDTPDGRKLHQRPTPLAGGIALLLGFVPAVVIAALSGDMAPSPEKGLVVAACTAGLVLIGLADDRHDISPRARLILSFAIYGVAAWLYPSYDVRLLNFEHPHFEIGLATDWLALFFTSLCLVGLVNAVNMADGKNGLVIGLCLGWTILLTLRAPGWLSPALISLAAVLAVLLAFNLKGRLFLGDGGAYGAGAAIGLMAIATYNAPGSHSLRSISAEEIIVLFAVPVLDSFRLTIIRLRRGQSPMSPDRDHLHHHLQRRFGWPGGLVFYWIFALLPAAIVFLLV